MNTDPDRTPVPDQPAAGGDEVEAFRGDDAVEVKAAAAAARAQARRALLELQNHQKALREELDAQRKAIEAEYNRRRSEMEAMIAPLQKQLAQLQEVAWTADLYLGRDESLHLLREGKPADADTPITIRQKVLVMAEESLVMMDRKETGMDSADIPDFVNWLLEAPENLDRVLPEPKGVVVLIPTRVKSNSGNVFEDTARNAENTRSFWLIRNGENVYLLNVDPELSVTERLLPHRTEFTEVFDQRLFGFNRNEPVKPGSDEWMKMEEAADARRRHYMRIMLVLQGLVDRTTVWAPLPPRGVNLMSVKAQNDGHVVLIQDDENSIQLGDGHESFRDWQTRLNALLRPGLRVIGDWYNSEFNDLRERERGWTGPHPRLYPPSVDSRPDSEIPHVIEGRRDNFLVIRYARTDKIYKRERWGGEYRTEATQRASLLIKPTDTWVLPYDLVTTTELDYFLNSRDERSKNFLSMVPTIRAAIAAKKVEAQEEAPFRDLIARALVEDGAAEDGVEALVEDLVTWWKVANTWAKPLNGEPEHEAKALKAIRREHRARKTVSTDATDVMVAAGQKVPGVIAIARNRQGKWFAYAPSVPAHDTGVFLDITPIRKDGTLGETKTWQTLAQRSASILTTAWEAEDWKTWKFAANPRHYLTGPERDSLIVKIRNSEDTLADGARPVVITETFNPANPKERMMRVYCWAEGTPKSTALRKSPKPFGWRSNRRGDKDLVTGVAWHVTKDHANVGIVWDEWASRDTNFDKYAATYDHLDGIPWWPEDAHRYPDTRPRLIWADEDLLAEMSDYQARCAAKSDEDRTAEREARIARDSVVYQYVDAVQGLIRAQQETTAKTRFLEDYGRDAMDLWPAHLETLKIKEPLHRRTLWGLIAIAMLNEHPFVGQTLEALADSAWSEHKNSAPGEWHPNQFGPEDVGEWGHIRVPAIELVDDYRGEMPFH